MELTKKQEEGLKIAVARYHENEKYTVIAGYAGTGKAQPVDTLIPTPQGWRKLGELKIGDYVYDRTGKPTKILKVFPQGEKQVYTLFLKDGRSTRCAGDHLWTVLDKKNQPQTLTTEELLKKGLTNSAGFKYAVPNNLPVEYKQINYSIDPYVIGAFLGDGCCKQRQLTLSSETEEIPTFIKELIGAKETNRNSLKNYNWTFTLQSPIQSNNNLILKFQTKTFFADYQKEICCSAQEKRIPDIYKRGSIDQRLSLLQGLFDTDGSITDKDENRFNIRFTSTSYQLILDIQEVLYSLGYSSTIIHDKRSEKYTTGACYELHVNIPNEEKFKLFRLQRKKDIALKAKDYPKHKNYSKESITNIVKENYTAEMVCIYVDNPEHLYLTNDYIVTHNTTLVKFIIAALNIPPEDVCYIAYTGKAVSVLKENGCKNAMTAHKLLYKSYLNKDGSFTNIPRTILEKNYHVIVVDEISMLPNQMWELLMRHNAYVIALGDPGQLPPIGADNHLLDHPHVFLDEIMRQAKESEIIRLTMKIRNGEPLTYYKGKEVRVVPKSEICSGLYQWADQIIAGKNITKNIVNMQMRELLGFSGSLTDGDKIICLKNNWELVSNYEEPLVNGLIGIAKNPRILLDPYVKKKISIDFYPNFLDDAEIFKDLKIDKQLLDTGEPSIDKTNFKKFPKKVSQEIQQFDYAYCITCHKSQGSQYDKVLVLEEHLKTSNHKKWLYTAATRAKKKLIIVKE